MTQAQGAVEVSLEAISTQDLRPVLSPAGWAQLGAALHAGREGLRGKTVWMVNSTAVGGGVAELLRALMPYWLGVDLDVRWAVIQARPAFFRVTKRVHNMLHGHPGDGGELGARERRLYEASLAPNAVSLKRRVRARDIVVLHDPQTAGLTAAFKASGATVVCRSHVGADHPNALVRAAWDFLRPYVAAADAVVFTRRASVPPWLGAARVAVIPPSIDPCATKNVAMEDDAVRAILTGAALAGGCAGHVEQPAFRRRDGSEGRIARRCLIRRAGRPVRLDVDPLVVHITRWDRLKDPVGVMESFASGVLDRVDARLIVAGPSVHAVADDPDAAAVYREVERHWQLLPDAERERIDLARLPMRDLDENAAIVNALQRQATVIVKKSLEEGFGLGVTEAMWKRRPVVASRVGGHQDQIQDGTNGVLLDDPRDLTAFGHATADLLLDSDRARRLGDAAHQRVREHYLPDRYISRWIELLATLSRPAEPCGRRRAFASRTRPGRRAGGRLAIASHANTHRTPWRNSRRAITLGAWLPFLPRPRRASPTRLTSPCTSSSSSSRTPQRRSRAAQGSKSRLPSSPLPRPHSSGRPQRSPSASSGQRTPWAAGRERQGRRLRPRRTPDGQ
jgi:trehalose synthase